MRKAYRADGACTAGRPGAPEQVSLTQRRGWLCAGAFPELYDKVKPEVDVVTIGKRMADVIM